MFTVLTRSSLEDVVYIRVGAYDLVLLDIMLPRLDGLSVLRQMRSEGVQTPVLMLTARTTVPDKVAGLNAGADDYLTKPFDPEELLARVGAMTRRKGAMVLNELSFQDLTLDLNTVTLRCGARSATDWRSRHESLSETRCTVQYAAHRHRVDRYGGGGGCVHGE